MHALQVIFITAWHSDKMAGAAGLSYKLKQYANTILKYAWVLMGCQRNTMICTLINFYN